MPIVVALGNQRLQDFHWVEIKQVLQIEEFPLEERQFRLGELIKFDVAAKQEEVVHISTTASQEHKLMTELNEIRAEWNQIEFDVVKHKDKDAYKLQKIDQIVTVLDDSLSRVSDIQGNRYVKRLQEDVEKEHNMLLLIADTIE